MWCAPPGVGEVVLLEHQERFDPVGLGERQELVAVDAERGPLGALDAEPLQSRHDEVVRVVRLKGRAVRVDGQDRQAVRVRVDEGEDGRAGRHDEQG